jgi:hypothetical protein
MGTDSRCGALTEHGPSQDCRCGAPGSERELRNQAAYEAAAQNYGTIDLTPEYFQASCAAQWRAASVLVVDDVREVAMCELIGHVDRTAGRAVIALVRTGEEKYQRA